jgi:hypothetical protein
VRWIAAPLAAFVILMGAGFISALSETTTRSAGLTASAEDAPKDTASGAEETATLPTVADMTGRQADAFDELVDALQQTGEQVKTLNARLRGQSIGLARMKTTTSSLLEPLRCSSRRLTALIETSDDAPPQLTEAVTLLQDLISLQDRSLKHLRSINRKLSALEALAVATSAEPLPRPAPLEIDVGGVGGGASGVAC